MNLLLVAQCRSAYAVIVCSLIFLAACKANSEPLYDYQIVVSGSATPAPVEFAGSYTSVENGVEVIHDMAGSGTYSVTFQSQLLKRARVQPILGTGLLSLTVYRNGEVVFESPPTDSSAPILYTAPKQAT